MFVCEENETSNSSAMASVYGFFFKKQKKEVQFSVGGARRGRPQEVCDGLGIRIFFSFGFFCVYLELAITALEAPLVAEEGDTFYHKRTHFFGSTFGSRGRERILSQENTFFFVCYLELAIATLEKPRAA